MNFVKNWKSSFAIREERLSLRIAIFLTAQVVIGTLLGLVGPFGTYTDMNVVNRFVYWISITALSGAQAHLILPVAGLLLPMPKWPTVIPLVVGSALCSVLGAFEVLFLEEQLREPELARKLDFATVYFYVFLITLILASLFILGGLRRYAVFTLTEPDGEGETEEVADVPFYKRLSGKVGCRVICIEAEDHYLRVHTPEGSEMIFLRMKDAVEELQNVDGVQVHRSYWIAIDAIESQKRNGEGAVLTLTNGMEIPVSRGRLKALRQEGVLTA